MHYSFVTYGSWEGNAGFIRTRHLGAQLLQRGHRVSYILDDVAYNRTALDLDRRANLVFVPDSRHPVKQLPSRRRVIRELAPDYIHLLNSHAKSVLALAGLKERPKIVADWDEPPTLRPFGPGRKAIEHWADWWLRRNADVRIACTIYLQQRFRAKYGMDTVYIPHAPYFVEQPAVDSPFSEPTAVYMGNLVAAWDHDILFEAARLMKLQGHRPRIAILGHGPQMGMYQSFVAQHGLDNVNLAGFVGGVDLWRHLRHAHVLLFPIRDTILNRSRCPSKIFAYAQAKRPLIANRVGELPQLLGELPIWVEESPQALADAIVKHMSLPPQPDVEYRLENHNWSDRADKLLAALDAQSS